MVLSQVVVVCCIALIPMLFYAFVFWCVDHHEREPWWLVGGLFGWGAAPAVFLAVFLETSGAQWIEAHPDARPIFYVVIAPVCEELAKGVALVALLVCLHREIDGLVDGVLYGSLIGFGFSATEDTLYFLTALERGGMTAVIESTIMRSYLTGLGHALFTSCIGVAIAVGAECPSWHRRIAAVVVGFAAASLLHGIFNASSEGALLALFAGTGALGTVMMKGLRRERRWIQEELAPELERGILTWTDLFMLRSPRRRTCRLLEILFRRGWMAWRRRARYYRTATDLAFTRRHLRVRGDWSLRESIDELQLSLAEQATQLPRRRTPALP